MTQRGAQSDALNTAKIPQQQNTPAPELCLKRDQKFLKIFRIFPKFFTCQFKNGTRLKIGNGNFLGFSSSYS